jgi:hypothetical protein
VQAEDRVTMPLSSRTFVWHSDGTWLDVDPVRPNEDDAESWHVWPEDTDTVSSAAETAPGNSALPTWWLCRGEAPAEIPVVAWRGDNADVAVVRLGGLWIAEWSSVPMTLFVSIGGKA